MSTQATAPEFSGDETNPTLKNPQPKSASAQVNSLKAKAAARGLGRKASTIVTNSTTLARRPKPFEWVRVHPDAENYSIILPAIVFGKEESEDPKQQASMQKPDIYIVHPDLMDHPTLAEDATKQYEFSLAITRGGKLFVWQHTFLDKENSWLDSEEENIAAARSKWIRQISGDGVYNRRVSEKNFNEPNWPDRDFDSILIEALGDKFVTSEDHPLFAKLLGND